MKARSAEVRDCRERSKEEEDHYDDEAGEPSGIKACDIPTSKADLIAWLNMHFKSDNG